MDVSKLVLKENGFPKYNPMQEKCIDKLDKSLVVSAPTASGKTIVAELFILEQVLNKNKKVIYTCPLRALASEHYKDFKRKYPDITFALSTGDLDSSSSYLKKFDVIFTTYEKCFPNYEQVLCKINNELKIISIGNLFNLIKENSKITKLSDREIIEPKIKIETIGFKHNQPMFTPIKSLLKIKNTSPIVNLKLDSGREFSCTNDHKIFTQENGKLVQTLAKDSLNKYSIALNQIDIFSTKIKELNLNEIFTKEPNKLSVIFSSIDFNELTKLLTNKIRTKRRAKDLAKYYIKTKRISLKLALKSKTIKVTHFNGQRSDARHKCKPKLKLDYNFGKFLGYFIAEGNFDISKNRETILRLPGFNKWIKKDVEKCLNKLKLPHSFCRKTKIFSISSMPYYILLRELGISKRKGKNLPEFVFFAPDRFNQGLLEGLFNGDCGPSPQSLDYSTMNKKLAYQIQILLLRYGITTYIYPQKVKGYAHTYYRLTIMGGQNADVFKKVVENLRPLLKNKINYLTNQKNKRHDLLHNIPVNCFLDKKHKIKINDKASKSIYMAQYRNMRTSKDTFSKFIQKNNLNYLTPLVNAPIGQLKIKKITKKPKQKFVFNLQTGTGNYFLANGILVKNCASLLRHKTEWLKLVGCVIVDEIHELDSDRGPVLEIALTQMRSMHKDLSVLGLSATIPNAKELAKWLNSELVESEFRPVHLKEGVLLEKEVEFKDGSKEKGDFEDTLEKNLEKNNQALIFANARKRAEGLAKKLSYLTKKTIKQNDSFKLEKIASSVLNTLEQPTEQCESLATCIKEGIAFHHAGLLPKQRELVEENFREGLIKIICATPTLAAGVNTPADIVLIPSLYRYGNWGMELINVREYKQMSGRSGRPKFSTEGKSIVVANSETQKEMYMEKYIHGEMEGIKSKLSNKGVLRTHVLALIATGDIYNDKSIWKFFERTLFAKQSESITEIYENVCSIVEQLKEYDFVENKGDYFVCTPVGKRISDLFLDPESAFALIHALKDERPFKDFSYLFAWANCYEFFPLLRYSKKLEGSMWEEYNSRMNELPYSQETLLFDNQAVEKFFSALMMENWILEKREQELFKDFGLAPGMLFSKSRILEWLAYATIELSKVIDEQRHALPAKKLSLRIKYGVKEELLKLVELRGIGRARARKLFNAGITSPTQVRNNILKVEQLLGPKVAGSLKKQLKIE